MINRTKEIIIHLEKERMHYEPYYYVRKFIKNTRDIYEEKNLLKSISFNEKSISYLVGIIVNDIKDNKRFRRHECLKVIKKIIKNRKTSKPFNEILVDNLFHLYQYYIFTGSDEIQWAVSVFIKDQLLNDEHIKWLIEHFEESNHIVNRLLRYPACHKLITDWATYVYKNDIISDRLSEVIGIIIDDEDIPDYIKVDIDTLMWAIYYSKCTKAEKRKLILKYLDYEDYSSALEVAARLELSNISKELLSYYKKMIT